MANEIEKIYVDGLTICDMMDRLHGTTTDLYAAKPVTTRDMQRDCLIDNIRMVDDALKDIEPSVTTLSKALKAGEALEKLVMIAKIYRKELSKQLNGVGQ